MECLTEKLEGKYPIGKTTVVGDEVIPIGSTGPSLSRGTLPGTPGGEMDPMKFLTTFDYGETTPTSGWNLGAGIPGRGGGQRDRSGGRGKVSRLGLQRIYAWADTSGNRWRSPGHPF